MNVLFEDWKLWLPVVLGISGVSCMLPRERPALRSLGSLMGLVALAMLLVLNFPSPVQPSSADLPAILHEAMFHVFAITAIVAGTLMITDKNPVYSALYFALVTLSVCGLFLRNSAPFLSAATIIIYAGAIIVTFLFVIMLAQQGGLTAYDRHAHQPTLVTIAACGLLLALLVTLREAGSNTPRFDRNGAAMPRGLTFNDSWKERDGRPDATAAQKTARPAQAIRSNVFSEPPADNPREIGSLRGLGRSLFTDYLFAVELAGTVLLIAAIGAIAIAPRRAQGHL